MEKQLPPQMEQALKATGISEEEFLNSFEELRQSGRFDGTLDKLEELIEDINDLNNSKNPSIFYIKKMYISGLTRVLDAMRSAVNRLRSS